jgi:hypothetical protein
MPRRFSVRPASRRQFIQSASLLAAPCAGQALAQAAPVPLEAFAGGASVKAGGSLDFYFRNPAGSFNAAVEVPLTISRFGWPDRLMRSTRVKVLNKTVPADASANGCLAWGVGYRLDVPLHWPSGLYWATVGADAQACAVPFVVRPASGKNGPAVLVQVPVTTAQAYNPYGGKSLYGYNSSNGVPGTQVSFNRPFADPLNPSFDPWQPPLVRWLEKNGIAADFCTSLDLHVDGKLLSGYQLFLTVGHDEYWSRTMRNRLDAFVANGGNVAIFSGNTCWWQVRLEDLGGNGRRMVCYKSRSADPGGTPETKTTYWWDLATPWPENSTIGLSFRSGAAWTNAFPRPVSPFIVKQPGHWALAGTGLAADAGFGADVVGYETDAAQFRNGLDGRFYPSALDGAPATLQILAQADCSQWDALAFQRHGLNERSGQAAIAIFSNGGGQGTVFNAGTTDWTYGLQGELDGQSPNAVGLITRNVVRKLSVPWSETAEVRQWHAYVPGSTWICYYTLGGEAPADMVLDGAVFRALPLATRGSAPVYRYRSTVAGPAGHRYGLGLLASAPGWTNVGIAFHAFASARVGAVPVYQYRATDPWGQPLLGYTTSPTAPVGWVSDGVVFYAPAG